MNNRIVFFLYKFEIKFLLYIEDYFVLCSIEFEKEVEEEKKKSRIYISIITYMFLRKQVKI
jgi:hypothetical protein